MKKKFLLPLVVAAFAIGVSSCEKEVNHGNSTCFDDQDNEVAMTPEELDAAIIHVFDDMEVLGGTETSEFYMENEGIPAFFDVNPFDDADFSAKKDGPCSLTGKNELTVKQKAALKEAWMQYMKCRKAYAENLKSYYNVVRRKQEAHRDILRKSLHAGKITRIEFNKRMADLRANFKELMKERGAKHREGMRKCYISYVNHVAKILSKAQYAIWIKCHKAHLPVKKHHDPKKREQEKERK